MLERRGKHGVVRGGLKKAQVECDDSGRGRQQVFDDLGVIRARVTTVVCAELGERALVDGDDGDEAARVARSVRRGAQIRLGGAVGQHHILYRGVQAGQRLSRDVQRRANRGEDNRDHDSTDVRETGQS